MTFRLGVVVALTIIVSCTLLLSSSVLKSNTLDRSLYLAITSILAVCTISSLFFVALKDPGIVITSPVINDEEFLATLPYCDVCGVFQLPRTAHCGSCNCCIEGLDHHCPWVGKCIGRKNMFAFSCFNVCWITYFFFFLFAFTRS
jgi:hypothetical protein